MAWKLGAPRMSVTATPIALINCTDSLPRGMVKPSTTYEGIESKVRP